MKQSPKVTQKDAELGWDFRLQMRIEGPRGNGQSRSERDGQRVQERAGESPQPKMEQRRSREYGGEIRAAGQQGTVESSGHFIV